jgi:predicted RecA/RadA family phage recombinase
MKNQIAQGTPTSPRFAPCPSTVNAGDLVLIGTEPAVARDNYQANSGGAMFYFSGTFSGAVQASSSHSPITGEALGLGAKLYASGTVNTLPDGISTVTTGLWISGDTSDTPFGYIDPQFGTAMASGTTNTAQAIRIGSDT